MSKDGEKTLNKIEENSAQASGAYSSSMPIAFLYHKKGGILPGWWSEARDVRLREYAQINDNFSGAVNKVITRLENAEFRVEARDNSIISHRNLANVFQSNLVEMSHFYQGFKYMLRLYLRDLFEQDNGAFLEIISEGEKHKPIDSLASRHLAHLDSSRCTRTGDPQFPVKYINRNGDIVIYHYSRVLFDSQLPSADETMYGVGFCWLSRCINSVQNLFDIATYNQEQLGSRPPQQLLIGQGGVDTDDIINAFESASVRMDNQGYARYSRSVVMGDSSKKEADVLIKDMIIRGAIDIKTLTELDMFTIALAGGYPPRDFWPATTTGATRSDAEFQNQIGASGYQSILNRLGELLGGSEKTSQSLTHRFLPPQLKIVFDLIDDDAEKGRAEVKERRANTWKINMETRVITERTAREQAVAVGDMTRAQFEREELESGRLPNGDSVLNLFYSKRFSDILTLPFQDVLDFEGNANNIDQMIAEIDRNKRGVMNILANIGASGALNKARQSISALNALKTEYEKIRDISQEEDTLVTPPKETVKEDDPSPVDTDETQSKKTSNKDDRKNKQKQVSGVGLPDEVAEYEDEIESLYQQLESGDISQSEFENELEDIVVSVLTTLFLLGAGIDGEDLTDESREFLGNQIQPSLDAISNLADDIVNGDFIPEDEGGGGNNIFARLGMWATVGAELFYSGMLHDPSDPRYEWVIDPIKDHCEDCVRLNGQVHTAVEWFNSGFWPKSSALKCFGKYCGCGFRKTNKKSSGNF